jgi:chemotaxis protein CheD
MPAPTLSALAGLAGVAAKVIVGVGEIGASNNPTSVLTTYSLGSCLGVTIFDPAVRAGGLLHVMLPDSSINPERARQQPAMFLDTGLPALFRAAYAFGVEKHRVEICVAGGAQVMDQGAVFNIGQRNYDALGRILRAHGLRLAAEQVGGLVSRTMTLNLSTGEVRLKIGGTAHEVALHRS